MYYASIYEPKDKTKNAYFYITEYFKCKKKLPPSCKNVDMFHSLILLSTFSKYSGKIHIISIILTTIFYSQKIFMKL